MSKHYFVTAIGTDSGKTLLSAIITEALQADYWKPIQTGTEMDRVSVQKLVLNPKSRFHPETYHFQNPLSPHAAAQLEGMEINPQNIFIPQTDNDYLVIEGAGGLLVPWTFQYTTADWLETQPVEIILIVNQYLGCINHTLLTLAEIKRRHLKVKGIVFNREVPEASVQVIEEIGQVPTLFSMPDLKRIDGSIIQYWAEEIKAFVW